MRAAGAVGLSHNLLLVIGMGVVVSIPVLFASYLFAKWVSRNMTLNEEDSDTVIEKSYEALLKQYGTLPSGRLSLAPICVPILLMDLGSISKILGLEGNVGILLQF